MSQSLCILGRQPAIGLAELESLYGADAIRPLPQAALISVDPTQVDFARLGSVVKLAKVLTVLPATNWDKLVDYIITALPEHLDYIPEGKIRFGLSVYDIRVHPKDINRSALQIKKVIKAAGRSVRVVPNTYPDLNSAQTLHNQLTGPTGMELVLMRDGDKTILAQVTDVQDINAYAARDQNRPKRDARVGMLPPKLAQIIINLAAGPTEPNQAAKKTVLDPFCGTGVVLQEALLMGYSAYGTDLEPRMVEYSQANLEWLLQKHSVHGTFSVAVGDATNLSWQPFDLIAGETYLGRPFSSAPNPMVLNDVMRDVDTIHRKFLRNVAQQTKPGFRLCIGIPAWKIQNGFKHLPLLDHLEEMGYTRVSFVHAKSEELIYHRPEQIVARELVVLIRK